MENELIVKVKVDIKAPADRVWQALTDPALIKRYLMDTDTVTDWKKGSDITWSGEWKGKHYVDKGKIVDIIQEQLLHTTYLSGMGGKADKPENYANVIYELTENGDTTTITLTQDNNKNVEEQKHSEQNWKMVLGEMKKMLEE